MKQKISHLLIAGIYCLTPQLQSSFLPKQETLIYYMNTLLRRPQREQAMVQPARLGLLTFHGPLTTTDKFHEALQQCLDDQSIKGILLKIDAEWGTLSLCEVMFQELKRAGKQKPIIALIEKNCCREPYLVATAAQMIIANIHSVIGIIGTSYSFFEQRADPSKECFSFYAGKYTPLGDLYHHMTTQEQQMIAEQLELQYQQMCATIAEQRNLDLDSSTIWAEGRPFLGMQAVEMHLIDSLGTLSDAQEAMSELLATKDGTTEPYPTKFKLVPFAV